MVLYVGQSEHEFRLKSLEFERVLNSVKDSMFGQFFFSET